MNIYADTVFLVDCLFGL